MSKEYVWLAGWYATRLHAVKVTELERLRESEFEFRSECGVLVREKPRTEWAAKRISEGIPRCKHCERRIKNTVSDQP
jgi:hypothetical protein